MKRVYLDSNIYRYLKNDDSFILNKINETREEYIYYYSYAHLSDLSKDKTDKKFDDLLFMEKIVDNHFLNLNPEEVFTNVLVASPTEAYNSMNFNPINEAFDFNEFLQDLTVTDEDTPELKEAKEKLNLLLKMPFNDLGIPNLPENIGENNLLNKLIPSFSNSTSFLDLMKGMLDTFTNLHEDPKIWREFRNYSIQSLGNNKFDIDINNENFNELLKETPLQKSFLEFVEESFTHNKSLEKQREYNFFLNAYNCLNLLGLDKEKSKKVVFSSFQNDGLHSYYGAHCNYLVSDDEQLRLKAKTLYRIFDIETEVINYDDFKSLIGQYDNKTFSFENFSHRIINVFEKSELNNTQEIEGKIVRTYSLNEILFGYFNKLDLVIALEESPMYIFYNENYNYSRFTSYKEFEKITNKIVAVLGQDSFKQSVFLDEEKAQIKNNEWKGRAWHFQTESFYLEVEQHEKKLCFYYIPNYKIQNESIDSNK